jgi:hypothetical protein
MSLGTFSVLLTFLFVVLKLIGVVAWPWLYVFLPVLLALGLSLVLFAVAGVFLVIGAIVAAVKR